MESNNEYDEILIRYLFDEETEEERVFVEAWLNASEENQRYFNRLKKVWQLTDIKQDLTYIMDEGNLEEKWNRLEQNITEEAQIIPINKQEVSEGAYGEEEKPARKPAVYRLLVSVAVAASVLLVVGLGWMLFSNDKPETPVVQHTGGKTDSITFVVRHEVNTTGNEKRIQLADGSLIVLADKSEITYREPFTNSRDITLMGKAYFKVAKDQAKPFTVVSGDLATTALGTEFTVTAFSNQKRIVVRLYEGKVVVKPLDKANSKLKKDVYLLPGEEFIYNKQTTNRKQAFSMDNTVAPEEIMNQERYRDNPLMPEDDGSSWYMFNNESLGEALDQLAGLYNVPIIYDQEDVRNIYLTGKYDRSDSLEYILHQIGILHDLRVTKKDSAFIITK